MAYPRRCRGNILRVVCLLPVCWGRDMSVVIHVRVPRELKRRLDELRVNISEEVRLFLERRIRQLEAERLVRELEELLSSMRKVSDSTRLIREDRDSMAVYR